MIKTNTEITPENERVDLLDAGWLLKSSGPISAPEWSFGASSRTHTLCFWQVSEHGWALFGRRATLINLFFLNDTFLQLQCLK